MIQVTCFKTFDGVVHEDHEAAAKHLDTMYGDRLTRLAHKLVQAEKYTKIIDVLDANTQLMREIIRIKDDIPMESSDD